MTYTTLHRFLAILFLSICGLIVSYSYELGKIRGYIGDVVIIMFLYSFVQSIHRSEPLSTVVSLLILGFFTEWMQYIDILGRIGGENSPLLLLVFGSTYDPWDLLAYTVGGIVIYSFDRFLTSYIVR